MICLPGSSYAEAPFPHQGGHSGCGRVGTACERPDHVFLLSPGAILAELEFGFHSSCNDFEADDVLQHPAAILVTE